MWVPQSQPPVALGCPGANPATVLHEFSHPKTYGRKVGTVLTPATPERRGKNKQTDFLKTVEQRPGHVFAINLALPKEKNKAPCYAFQRCYIFSGK